MIFVESVSYPALSRLNIASVVEKIETKNQIFLAIEKLSDKISLNKF
jgi:hypothetical protein